MVLVRSRVDDHYRLEASLAPWVRGIAKAIHLPYAKIPTPVVVFPSRSG